MVSIKEKKAAIQSYLMDVKGYREDDLEDYMDMSIDQLLDYYELDYNEVKEFTCV